MCFLVVSGRLNKQIAAALGTTEKTVKVHRSRVMAKMQAHSLAELVRFVEFLKRAPSGEGARPVARRRRVEPDPTPGLTPAVIDRASRTGQAATPPHHCRDAAATVRAPVALGRTGSVGLRCGARSRSPRCTTSARRSGSRSRRQPQPVSTLWPPNAILLGALLLAPLRDRGRCCCWRRCWPTSRCELQSGVPLPMVLVLVREQRSPKR